MKKSDLKTGMWVETRNGQQWIVLLETADNGVVVHSNDKGGFNYLNYYNEDLLMTCSSSYDIMRVFQPSPMCYLSRPTEDKYCIFDRNTISNQINAEIENLEEIKKQAEDLKESLKNLKIKLQF